MSLRVAALATTPKFLRLGIDCAAFWKKIIHKIV